MEDEEFDYTRRQRKDTRRWCKGREGREHLVRHISAGSNIPPEIDRCVNCGKVFKTHWKIKWFDWDNSCSPMVRR